MLAFVQADIFASSPTGRLVPIDGTDPRFGVWQHVAFVPHPLPTETPSLSVITFNAVAKARAEIAGLDVAARQLPNPALLRRPTVRREAQSTSALEGTFAPLSEVLAADAEEDQPDAALREVLNYVRTAEHAFRRVEEGRELTLGLLRDLHSRLVRGTIADVDQAGRVRSVQVMIGSNAGARIRDATFVPSPPGMDLEHDLGDWVDWVRSDHDGQIDPVVAAGMAHYQFETLHPFNDGNGRIGRLLIVLHLQRTGVLREPSLTVSPWFEARRAEYYDGLRRVSSHGDWDGWIRFFARGLESSAADTSRRLIELLAVQRSLKEMLRVARLRADTAFRLVDFAFEQPIFTVRQVQRHLGVTYVRANGLVAQMVSLGVLAQYDDAVYDRRFTAPDVLAILLR